MGEKSSCLSGCLFILVILGAVLFWMYVMSGVSFGQEAQTYQLVYDSIIMPSAPEPLPTLDDDQRYIHYFHVRLCDNRAIRLSLYVDGELVESDDVSKTDGCFERDDYRYEYTGPERGHPVWEVVYPSWVEQCSAPLNTGVCNLWKIYAPHVEKPDVILITPTPERS